MEVEMETVWVTAFTTNWVTSTAMATKEMVSICNRQQGVKWSEELSSLSLHYSLLTMIDLCLKVREVEMVTALEIASI